MLIYAEITCVEVQGNMVHFWINKELMDRIIIPLKNIVSYGKLSHSDLGMHTLDQSTGVLYMKCMVKAMYDHTRLEIPSDYKRFEETRRVITLTNGITYVFGSQSATSFVPFIDAFEKHCSPPESVDLLS